MIEYVPARIPAVLIGIRCCVPEIRSDRRSPRELDIVSPQLLNRIRACVVNRSELDAKRSRLD